MSDPEVARVVALAASHGLAVTLESVSFNDMGLDFRVGFATTCDDEHWVLRLPRRPDVMERARQEAGILELLSARLPVAVPQWKIFSEDLIAYPMLPGQPGLTFDAATYEVTWHFDKDAERYVETLAQAVSALHALDPEAGRRAGMPEFTPAQIRQKWLEDIESAAAEFEAPSGYMSGLRQWVHDHSFWPDFSVPIHGDLYAGHVMVDPDGTVRGIIDWTEARIADPAVDLVGHLKGFGEGSLIQFLHAYSACGGRTWPRLPEHCLFLQAAAPINYAVYALKTGNKDHHAGAQEQLLAAVLPKT